MKTLIVGCVATLLLSTLAWAKTISVSPGQSIESATRSANDGDIVEVMPGTYKQTIRFWGKAVTLRSKDGPETTIIDGAGSLGPLVSFFDKESRKSVIEGFTIANGMTDGGGGAITAQNGSSPTIRSNIIRNNKALIGAGIYLYVDSSPLIENNTFTDNRSEGTNTGGAAIAASFGGHPIIRNNTFLRNSVFGNPSAGGAIFVSQNSGATIDSNYFEGNSCTFPQVDIATGGAIHVIHDTRANGGVTISNNVFLSNLANYGGAVGTENGASVMYVNNQFVGNHANYYGGAYLSHAVQQVGAFRRGSDAFDVVFDGNQFLRNSSGEFGGGIYVSVNSKTSINDSVFEGNIAGLGGGAIHVDGSAITLTGNDIKLNSAGLYGAAILAFRNSSVLIERNKIVSNSVTGKGDKRGGAVHVANSSAYLYRNVIMDHQLSGNSSGGAIYITQATDTIFMENNLITNNSASFGSAVFIEQSILSFNHNTLTGNNSSNANSNVRATIFPRQSVVGITNAILWNTDVPISNFDLSSQSSITQSLQSDPRFVNPGGANPEDYKLSSSSPAIDRAVSNVQTDLEGQERPVGSAPDIGSYEYSANKFIPLVSLFRFWNNTAKYHFFSGDVDERNFVMSNLDWVYEGPSFYVYSLENHPAGTVPVYRFYNPISGHFYTASETEKAAFERASGWNPEGAKFYAFPDKSESHRSKPVYRFKSKLNNAYFYTISEEEKDLVLTLSDWSFEGIAFFAFPSP